MDAENFRKVRSIHFVVEAKILTKKVMMGVLLRCKGIQVLLLMKQPLCRNPSKCRCQEQAVARDV